jgi:two-component system, response regulator YesN
VIRVLVVEDDKLARKGLIHAMPWAEHGMTVVGEAANGFDALDFLASHEVDLALTDFAMPGMSGGDLMRAARGRFPALRFVVLTFHQELEFAQEAFRLGALDYIAKIQLEKEGFAAVLARIRERFLERESAARSVRPEAEFPRIGPDRAFVLLSVEEVPRAEGLELQAARFGTEPVALCDGAFMLAASGSEGSRGAGAVASADAAGLAREVGEGWAVLELSGLSGETLLRVAGLVRKYMRTRLFYESEAGRPLPPRSLASLEEGPPAAAEGRMAELGADWLALDWVFDREAFDRLLGVLRASMPAAAKLSRLLVEIEGEWNRIFCPIASMRVEVPERLLRWADAAAWLASLRDSAFSGNKRLSYAGGVVAGVMRAARIVDAELGSQLLATEVAKRVNMSRGYFCRCFKDLAGRPFNEYLQRARVEKAKLLLRHTDAPLSQVAEQVGYADEKYFAKVFREQAGLTPSGYRQSSRDGRRMSPPG